MIGKSVLLYSFALCLFIATAQSQEGKNIGLFNVVTFPNDVCASDNKKNGTCYTAEECSNKGGSAKGNCAEGFGVCCVFQLDCNDTSSENNTYLEKTSITNANCKYKICPVGENICRIRFDFTMFTLAQPVTGTSVDKSAAPAEKSGSLGQCAEDSFSVSGGNGGSPVICGTNTGYHMIVDATKDCHMVNFRIGGSSTPTRQWDIFVSQYECGNDENTMGGPPGCLQYHVGLTGNIQSFNFPTTTSIGATVQHLANQQYKICIRREASRCSICYKATDGIATTAIVNGDATNMGTFGLSVSSDDDLPKASTNSVCATDYVYIAGSSADGTPAAAQANKFCGRLFSSTNGGTANAEVCTRVRPFEVGVFFDGTEATVIAIAAKAETNELSVVPSGTIGFKLAFEQKTC